MTGRYKAYPEYKDSNHIWLGNVPVHWDILSAKRIFSAVRVPVKESDEQLAASQKYGVVPQSLMMKLNNAKVMLALKGTDSFRHVDIDNFVISLRSFEGGIEHSAYEGCVSPAYTVLKAALKQSPAFFKYLLKCEPFIVALQSTTDSLRDGKSISYEQFGSIYLPYCSFEEQQKIANFLDHETAKIDTLITKQEKLIELLKEKRQAVISHAVTKGLNPDAPMKDSGVEWLGEVPEHWGIVKLSYFLKLLSGDGITSNLIESEGKYPVMGGNGFRGYTSTYNCDGDYALIGRQGALCGNINIAKGKFFASEHAVVVYPHKEFNLTFLSEFLRFMNLGQYSVSAAQPGISVERINGLKIVIPPLAEQELIGDFIDRNIHRFEELTLKSESMIMKLKERKTALISAAVTGKIDVRDWQEPTYQESA